MAEAPPLLDRLKALLSDITGAKAARLDRHSNQQTTPGWDSVANLSLITSLEEEFGVIINTQDVLRLHSLGDIERFLCEQGIGGASPKDDDAAKVHSAGRA